jgi:hypothetical protein
MLSSPLDGTVKLRLQEAERGDDPEILIGSGEQIFPLLAEAAEIEHTLMCSYLYAAFSLKDDSDPSLSPKEAAAVQRWRVAVMNVAVEEMGHLLMVANLTAAIGGRPHFTRPNFPVNPGRRQSGHVQAPRTAPWDQRAPQRR